MDARDPLDIGRAARLLLRLGLIEAEAPLQIIHRLSALRDRLKLLRSKGGTVALVPTMGALHDGHMTLVKTAQQQADHVVVSIFVNPKQFGPKEDFASYPRPADADAALLAQHQVDLLWMPEVEEVYPHGFATKISVAGLGDGLCGAARPGHFDGVATVVAKLLNQVRPDMALFGEKDWQQLAIIRRMALDLDLGVDVIGVPIVREGDGLALSSRNAYLTKQERAAAAALPKAMKEAVAKIEAGGAIDAALAEVEKKLVKAGFQKPDYVSLCGADDLEPLIALDRPARLLAAARLGKARLIDNMAVNPT
jgi:pantoate--beta-alanine ligase